MKTPSLRDRHELVEVWPDGPERPCAVRVRFHDRPSERFFLDLELCTISRRADGSLALFAASDDALYLGAAPGRNMTDAEVARELELYGRSGRSVTAEDAGGPEQELAVE